MKGGVEEKPSKMTWATWTEVRIEVRSIPDP